MQKFNVGDEVWIKAVVTKVDNNDTVYPYKVDIDNSMSSGKGTLWLRDLYPEPSTQSVLEVVFSAVNEKMKRYHNQQL